MLAQVTFAELLAANETETTKWREWFNTAPASAPDVPPSIALAKNVREFLLHMFAVELRFAERLPGSPVTDYETLLAASVANLFATGDRALRMYREYLATVANQDLAIVTEFPARTAGTIRASKRQMHIHALLHSMRHWAQLATALREAGHATDWIKDFLYSEVME